MLSSLSKSLVTVGFEGASVIDAGLMASVTIVSSSTISVITMALDGTPIIDARLAMYKLWNVSESTCSYVMPETSCRSDRHT